MQSCIYFLLLTFQSQYVFLKPSNSFQYEQVLGDNMKVVKNKFYAIFFVKSLTHTKICFLPTFQKVKILDKHNQDLMAMSDLLKSDPVQESLMGAIAQTLGSASEMSQDTILRFQNGFKKSIDNIQNRTTDSSK